MWDREATQLLGISAAQLRTNMIQVLNITFYILVCFKPIYDIYV